MPSANEHLVYVARHLHTVPALAKFADRMTVTRNGDDVVVTMAGRGISIRPVSQALAVGGDEIGLANDPQQTLIQVAKSIGQRLAQMDGRGD